MRRIAADTGGNPLAVRELGARLTASQLLGQAPLPHPLPVGRQIEEQYRGQVQSLPEDTRTFLLTAAADTTGDTALLLRAGRMLGFDRGSASPAEDADMVVVEPSTSFRHPLIRSAVYNLADHPERRRVHQALAEATDAEADPDRRAWHRAVAASGVDEDVADDLERAAGRCGPPGRSRGCGELSYESGAAVRRSCDPSVPLAGRGRRGDRGGQPCTRPGVARPGAARLTSPLELARAQAIEGGALMWLGQPARAPATLLEAAESLRPYDLAAARGMVLETMRAAVFAGRYAIDADLTAVARAALAMPLPPATSPNVDDLLLDGLATWIVGEYSLAAPLLRRGTRDPDD